ncbi:DMT family transporter [Rubellimicrobium aerolatum]|uniref:DMT family transporter n=1 Tax=Rubellimicrobium aerolatum TaxID=490979 RepID=A0ABW0SB38_9RHOB|nr:DMT family transporter [Rubellimicrobium aerolatum]MBP1805382.1 drug/metabolite transporter (DMT)-like permease [Rubellimicrobium aerolatum]
MESGANRPGRAAALVVGAMALFGLIDNFMRVAAETGGLWQFHLLRGLVAVALLGPAAWLMGARLRPLRPGRVLLRTCLNASAMVIYFGAVGIMPIAQAVAGLFTAPLWVVLFSVLLFGERVGAWRLSAVALGFAGVLLALGLRAEEVTPWSLLPVLAGALYGMGNLVTRVWCAGEGTLTLLGAFFGALALVGGVGCVGLALHPLPVAEGTDGFLTRGWVAPTGAFLLVTLVQAVGSLVGVGLSIRGYQIANPTLVSVMENTLLVFATLWAVAIWGEVPGPVETLGLALVTAAGVMIAAREPRRAVA